MTRTNLLRPVLAELKAECLALWLREQHPDWKARISVKDHAINTCSLDPKHKRYIFLGITGEKIAALMSQQPFSTDVICKWARDLPNTGHFLAQHYCLNFWTASVDSTPLEGKVVLARPNKEAISRRNTAKSCSRFFLPASRSVPAARGSGSDSDSSF